MRPEFDRRRQELGNRIHLSEVGEAKKEALRNLSLATRLIIIFLSKSNLLIYFQVFSISMGNLEN